MAIPKEFKTAQAQNFLGAGFKPLYLDESNFSKGDASTGKVIELQSERELEAYKHLYLAYVDRTGLNLWDKEGSLSAYFAEAVEADSAVSYGLKNASGELTAACCLNFMKLPRALNQAYFGFDFERFCYLRRVCYQEGSMLDLEVIFREILVHLHKNSIKCLVFHVSKEHCPLLEKMKKKLKVKKVQGANFLSGYDTFCVFLEKNGGTLDQ